MKKTQNHYSVASMQDIEKICYYRINPKTKRFAWSGAPSQTCIMSIYENNSVGLYYQAIRQALPAIDKKTLQLYGRAISNFDGSHGTEQDRQTIRRLARKLGMKLNLKRTRRVASS